MKKADILAAFEGVDHNILWGNRKQRGKQIQTPARCRDCS